MKRIKEILQAENPVRNITVEGWSQTARSGKSVTFVQLGDGSTLDGLQIVIDAGLPGSEEVRKAGVGAALRVNGDLVESPAKGQRLELRAKKVEIVGVADDDYPLQKKRHSFEFLRTIAHLRPRTRTLGAVFRVRHVLQMAIRRFFDERGFIEVHTPIITSSDCEGAGQMFRVTTLNPESFAMSEGKIDFSKDFFGRQTSLTVSGQLEGEIFAQAFKNIYTFGPTFRAENSNTARHASEFWMIEPEMAFCDLEGDMKVAEEFIRYIVQEVLKRCEDEIDFFSQWIEKGLRERLENLVNSDFEVMTYTEAIERLEKSERNFKFPIEWGEDLQSEHERYLTEDLIKKPAFVINYPAEIKAFYMRRNDDGKTVAAMDLLSLRVGEIIGGSQREERLDVLDEQFEKFNLNANDYWWYRDLRRFGGVPHAGFGLGLERALMFITGMQNIRDVIPFPRTPGNVGF